MKHSDLLKRNQQRYGEHMTIASFHSLYFKDKSRYQYLVRKLCIQSISISISIYIYIYIIHINGLVIFSYPIYPNIDLLEIIHPISAPPARQSLPTLVPAGINSPTRRPAQFPMALEVLNIIS